MKKILLNCVLVLFLVCISIMNLDTKPAVAANHVHTDACYAGHRHIRDGCPSLTYYTGAMPSVYGGTNFGEWGYMNCRSVSAYLYCSTCKNLIAWALHNDYMDDSISYLWNGDSINLILKYLDGNNSIVQMNSSINMWITSSTDDGTGWTKLVQYPNVFYRKLNPLWNSYYNNFYSVMSRTDDLTYWSGIGFNKSYSCPFCLQAGRISKSICTEWKCGLAQDETPDCTAYTVAPTVSVVNITSNTVLTEMDTNIIPQIRIFDNENDNLDCKYYIDGNITPTGSMTVSGSNPAKVVAFTTPFSTSGLVEGVHTIKVTVSDNFARDIGVSNVSFKVDKNAPNFNTPTVTNTVNSIRLDVVNPTDTVSGLAASAFRYTINGIPTGWLTTKYYTQSGLSPNTAYTYKVEVKDAVGHIKSTDILSTYTKLDTPVITATALEGSGIKLVVKDANPDNTLYKVQVNSLYAASTGTLTSTASWFTIARDSAEGGKKLILSGLASNTPYTITVSAYNSTSGYSAISTNISATTAPGIPSNITASNITSTNISLSWSGVSGAVSYDLLRSTIASDGTVIATKAIYNINSHNNNAYYYNDNDVVANQKYNYIIRCKNANSIYGNWMSTPFSIKTIPYPVKVTGVTGTAVGTSLNISWNAVTGAVGYEIEYGNGVSEKVAANQITYGEGKYNFQYAIRVRAFNASSGSNLSDKTLWTNAGAWSDYKYCYTAAAVPVLDSININNVTQNSVIFTWSTNSNPASVRYKLCIYKTGILDKEMDITGSSAGSGKLQYTAGALLPETYYAFKVKAINSEGIASSWSNEVSITTKIEIPAIVTGLKATADYDRIILYWNSADRAVSYDIVRSDSVQTDCIIASEILTASYADINVTPETEYKYKIIARNISGSSESIYLETRTRGNPPATPTITSITGSNTSCIVVWTPVETATGYEIKTGINTYNVGMDTSYTDNGLLPGGTYEYQVRARNANDNSDWSEVVAYHILPNAPDIPVNVITYSSGTQIQIKWDSIVGAVSYDVEIDNSVQNGITASEYWYTSAEGDTGTERIIRVRAVNEGGASGWSVPLAASLSEGGSIPVIAIPDTPGIVNSVSGSAITISWSKVDNATTYQLEEDNSIIYTGTGTSYFPIGLAEGSQHVYRVRAGNSSGFSEWSNFITVVIGISYSTVPKNINYYRISDTRTAIIWDNTANANGYRIEVNGVISDNVYYDAIAEISTAPGEQYSIRVADITQSSEDAFLDWSDEMTFRAPSALPSAVEALNITAAADAVTLDWGKANGAFGYKIEIDGQSINAGNVLTYSISGLTASTSYTVRICAYNDAGAGSWSEARTIMTNSGIAGIPLNISAETVTAPSAATGSAISIKWDSVDGAESYEVMDKDGKVYTSNTNSINIENLIPGERYYFMVRAAGTEAWSSEISIVPEVTAPVNVSAALVEAVVHIAWDKVGGAEYYEVEIDGIPYGITGNTSIDIDPAVFYVQRSIRISAFYGTQKSEWSENIIFNQLLPVSVDVSEGEEFSVIFPYQNADINNYKLTISFKSEELALVDACELTAAPELTTTYINELNTYLVITQQNGMTYISIIIEPDDISAYSGIADSIKLRSKITGSVTLQYSVTIK